jgi:hypothetical protein
MDEYFAYVNTDQSTGRRNYINLFKRKEFNDEVLTGAIVE